MNLGKLIRLNRLFSHPSGRLCSVAVDHLMGYSQGLPPGLRQIKTTLAAIVAGRPDAVTMHKGIAASAWTPYAGAVPLIVQSTMMRPDYTARQQAATPEDAVRWAPMPSPSGPSFAARPRPTISAWLPIASARHAVSRSPSSATFIRATRAPARSCFAPEDIAWAARCAVEVGVNVVKTPYCGEVAAFAQIVADSPVPVVAAGGPQSKTLGQALTMMSGSSEAAPAGPRSDATSGASTRSPPRCGRSRPSFTTARRPRKPGQRQDWRAKEMAENLF